MNKLARRTENFSSLFDNAFRSHLIPSLFDDVSYGSMFDSIFGSRWVSSNPPLSETQVIPTAEGSRIEVAVPGMKREDLRIDIDGDTLTLSAHVEKGNDTGRYRKSFSRSWTLQPGTLYESISASYVNGILRIEVPAKEPPGKRKMTVNIG